MGFGGKIPLGKDPRGTLLHMGGLLYHPLDLEIFGILKKFLFSHLIDLSLLPNSSLSAIEGAGR